MCTVIGRTNLYCLILSHNKHNCYSILEVTRFPPPPPPLRDASFPLGGGGGFPLVCEPLYVSHLKLSENNFGASKLEDVVNQFYYVYYIH